MIKYIKKGVCCCKKDCYYDNNNNFSPVIFEKGKMYNFLVENDVSIWVIYDENGSVMHTGRRFFIDDKSNDKDYLLSYHKHFENIRKTKLDRIYKLTENK